MGRSSISDLAMDAPAVVALPIYCVVLALWFGLFFGLNHPEIVLFTEYEESTCTIKAHVVEPRYCCYKSCSCSQCVSGAPSCGPLESESESRTVAACEAGGDPSDTSVCPHFDEPCCGGYQCCRECCQTCRSCRTECEKQVASEDGAGGGGGAAAAEGALTPARKCRQVCRTYECNCYCCSSVSNKRCTLRCPKCYKTRMRVFYCPEETECHEPTLVEDWGRSRSDAYSHLASYPVNTTHQCWYDPSDYSTVIFSRSYTTWKWVLTAFPSFCLLVIFMACTYAGLLRFAGGDEGDATKLNYVLWCGCLLPLCFFLPLYTEGRISSEGKDALLCVLTSFIVLGCAPLPSFFISDTSAITPNLSTFFYVFFFGFPMGVLVPILNIHEMSPNAKSALLGFTIVLFLTGVLLFSSWDWLARHCSHSRPSVRRSYSEDFQAQPYSREPVLEMEDTKYHMTAERAELDAMRRQLEHDRAELFAQQQRLAAMPKKEGDAFVY